MLDIYRPETGKNLPVLLFIHGGGWRKGSKDRMARVGKMLAAKNIVAVMINYRLSPAHKHPAHVDDAARAFAWTVKNIRKYGGDPDMVFVGGHSAGGHTAALLTCDPQYLKKVGLTPKNIYGTVLISGLYYLEPGPDPWNPDENGRVYKKYDCAGIWHDFRRTAGRIPGRPPAC